MFRVWVSGAAATVREVQDQVSVLTALRFRP